MSVKSMVDRIEHLPDTGWQSSVDPDGLENHTNAVFCWGNADHGQLGFGGIEEEQILLPKKLQNHFLTNVVDIACGIDHTLFITQDGTICACGSNDSGQLGHDKSRTKPELVDNLKSQVISQAFGGESHTVALSDTGQLFTWGGNQHGQLGRGTPDVSSCTVPKLVKHLSPYVIVQVACGYNHCLALTQVGALHAWGDNSHGQLGIGQKGCSFSLPQVVSTLQGVAITQVAAGGRHSFALTVSGTPFGWGKNAFGQLGVGHEHDQIFPCRVKTLHSQKVKYVACGEDHTAVITKEGGVFTFGAGMYGQLGHNSMQPEALPRKVFELMGSRVTQLACGRYHTVAYVPSSGRIYSFGLGGNGQLGVGTLPNRCNPITVKGPFVPANVKDVAMPFNFKDQQPYVVKRLYCGGDQTFVRVTEPAAHVPPDDFLLECPCRPILTVTQQLLDLLSSAPPYSSPPLELSDQVDVVFGSQASLNGSFLLPDDEHYSCSEKHSGVDLEKVHAMLTWIEQLPNPELTQQVLTALEHTLLPSLVPNPPDVEALRVYLWLPWCPAFDKPAQHASLIISFARVVLALHRAPGKILERWWGKLSATDFKRLVMVYKLTVVLLLEPLKRQQIEQLDLRDLVLCLEVLKKLNRVNIEHVQIVPYDTFYVAELADAVNIRREYIFWLETASHRRQQRPCFCDYPFIFDAQAKTLLLQTDALIQMQMAIEEVQRRNFSSLFMPTIDPVNPCLMLYVTRHNLVQDTINQLSKAAPVDYKKPLKVIFMGEEALDVGGVKKEFFLLLLREIMDPKYGMFKSYEDSRLIWFQEETFEESRMFNLIGVLCGLAIYNGTIIDLSFPLALYKKLLHIPITLEDMKELDPCVARSLEQLLNYDEGDIEEAFGLTFEVTRDVYGEHRTIALIEGGADIRVTADNRKQYVDAYLDFTFHHSVAKQYQPFADGFQKVCGGRILELFQPQELQAMVVGNENYDWNELEKNTDYKGDYFRNHATIQYFWDVFHELSLEHKKKFLMFLTGSYRIPIHGMKALKMFMQPTGGGDTYLPVAHTCFNLLDLPRYSSRHALRDKLLEAIQHFEGFGLV